MMPEVPGFYVKHSEEFSQKRKLDGKLLQCPPLPQDALFTRVKVSSFFAW